VRRGTSYTARYMEAIFRPGTQTVIHRHSGAEAWFTISGETCLETPDGTMMGRATGPPVIVPEGAPMQLTATGRQVRRGLVLVLHDASQPATTPAPDWQPRGLCLP
jgi:quercetin dioxygenase-like cupin family protein